MLAVAAPTGCSGGRPGLHQVSAAQADGPKWRPDRAGPPRQAFSPWSGNSSLRALESDYADKAPGVVPLRTLGLHLRPDQTLIWHVPLSDARVRRASDQTATKMRLNASSPAVCPL